MVVRISPVTLRISDGAAIFGSKVSIWRGPAMHEEENDGFPGQEAAPVLGAQGQEVGQGEAAEREAPHVQEVAAAQAGLAEPQHASGSLV